MGRSDRAAQSAPAGIGPLDWCVLLAALVLLNLSVTFRNVWPTLAVRATGDLSAELAVAALAIVAAQRWAGRVPAVALRAGAVAWVLLVAGRYVDVTTRSLYGRDVNLYWDFRHVPSVGAMFATVADPWQVAAVVAACVAVPAVLYAGALWGLGCIARPAATPAGRRLLGGAAALVVVLFAAAQLGWRPIDRLRFADPVAAAYAREAGELLYEASGAGLAALGPAPVIDSDLAHVAGADVFVIFLESYGAVAWESEALTGPLAGSRAELAADIRDTGRAVVSALVESTTFGGESWLAHISLLSGTEVRDDRTNVRLMAQDRDTLVKLFGRRGYRTVAIVPGLLIDWPEGAFYGYDEIYDHERLGYRGPPFGWWSINDQYALARVDALEVDRRDRAPLFVFFSTLSTHAPFTPAPPYQTDWARVVSDHPYDRVDLDRAWADQPDWTNLGPELRGSAPLRLRDVRGLPAAARRPRPRDDPGRRPPAPGARQRRGCLMERPRTRRREPHRTARTPARRWLPGRPGPRICRRRPHGHAAARAPRRVRGPVTRGRPAGPWFPAVALPIAGPGRVADTNVGGQEGVGGE